MKTEKEIKKLASKIYKVQASGGGQYTEGLQEGRIVGFIDGYTLCQQDNDKKYSEEELRSILHLYQIQQFDESIDEFIQNLNGK